jgi:hypothetical protein
MLAEGRWPEPEPHHFMAKHAHSFFLSFDPECLFFDLFWLF